jgi:thioredoxin-like negative regulator of GroEL/predicted O-methyltransferase YrrM
LLEEALLRATTMSHHRLSKARGARKIPVRYGRTTDSTELAEAIRAHKKGNYEQALQLYGRLLAVHPENLDAQMNLAALLVLCGDSHGASEAFAKASKLSGTNARAHRERGFGLLVIGQAEEALRALRGALELDPTMMGARLALVEELFEQGEHEQAIREAEHSEQIQPQAAGTHFVLHKVLFSIDPARSRNALERAVELDPGWAHARFALACGLAFEGAVEQAEATLAQGTVVATLGDIVNYIAGASRPIRAFASRAATLQFACSQRELAGPCFEFGVRHGLSTRLLAAALNQDLHAFDSFEGLPEAWQGLPRFAFSTGGAPPDLPPSVTVHKGWFSETLPRFLEHETSPPSLIHVDSDLYSSAKTVLDALAPRLVAGTILVFDEYIANASWREDEYRAFQETVQVHDLQYNYLALNWYTGQAVIRISSGASGE